jgi:sugar-phosphatase
VTAVESSQRPLPQIATLHVYELLFDMDGTLIDSIAAVEAAWKTLAEEEGIAIPSGAEFHGRTATDLVRSLVIPARFPTAISRLEELESSQASPVVALPGASELLTGLPPNRWSIVTSAAKPVAVARLAAAGLPMPSLLITGDDVASGKPDPEAYIAGKRHAGHALAFEDTVAGLRSARGAGCTTVAIVGTSTADELSPYADFLIDSLASVTAESLDDGGLRIHLRLAA